MTGMARTVKDWWTFGQGRCLVYKERRGKIDEERRRKGAFVCVVDEDAGEEGGAVCNKPRIWRGWIRRWTERGRGYVVVVEA